MSNVSLNDVLSEAKEKGSFFITATIRDKEKDENNLVHHVIQKEFARDDIIPSLDSAVSALGIKPEKPAEVISAPKIHEETKPLKIAILSHFHRMPDSFSPARATKNQIKILKKNGHEVVLFSQEGSKIDVECEVRGILPRFKMEKRIVNEEMRDKMIDVLREHLPEFDVCISQDFFIDSLITYREAVRNCGVKIPYLHFCRSGIGSPIDFSMDNAKYVYLNTSDAGHFARNIGVPIDDVRVVPNEKSPELMFNFHPITKMIIDRFQLWDRDIIQVLPVCSSRLDAKGINPIINTFVELKRLGKKVCLIVANSNGKSRAEELKRKQKMAKEMGLDENEFIFTSLLADKQYDIASELPNRVCAELMQLSNLMIMATIAEVSSNILLEAAMTKQLLVLNSDLPCLADAVDTNYILKYPFTSSKSIHYSDRDSESFSKLAKQIIGQIDSNKADKTFRHVWRNYNSYSIYHNLLKPLLYENITN